MSGKVFNLPDLGEGLTEAEVVEWLVATGDEVAIDQEVVVVETAKATVEVPCPYAGTVSALHGTPGQTIEVGRPLITIGGVEGDQPGLAGGEQYREEERAGVKAGASDEDEGSGAVLIGYGTGSGGGSRRRRGRRRAAAGASAAAPSTPAAPAEQPAPQGAVKVISPLVRRLAADNGIDLGSLRPAAQDGVIRRADVEAAISGGQQDSAPAASATSTGTAASRGLVDQRTPIKGLTKVMVDKLTTSRQSIPDATTWVDADATGLMETKDALKKAYPDAKIGVLPIMARIAVAALQRFPALNASVDEDAQEIVQHGAVHLGFAAQSPRGLVVPVIRDAHTMTLTELAAALVEMTAKAREGRLSPAELTGGTFTLNNYGVFGVDGSTPIINHPEAAMLGVGRVIDKPWAHEGQLALRKVTQLSFTFDHRVCDGGTAGGYLRFVADCVENPAVLLASL